VQKLQLPKYSACRKYFSRSLFFFGIIGGLAYIALDFSSIVFSVSIPLPLNSVKIISICLLALITSLIIEEKPSTFMRNSLRVFFVSVANRLPFSAVRSILFLLLIHTLVFFPLFLRGKRGPFFAGTDGETMQIDNLLSHSFSYPYLGVTNNPLQGLGGNQQWIYNYKIDPGYQLLFHLGERGFAASHWFWLLTLSISILLIVRTIGFTNWLAIPTALSIPYLLFSSNNYTMTLVFLIAPHNLYSIAVTNTIVFLLIRKSKTETQYFMQLILINLLFLYLVLLNPPYIVFVLPILLFTLIKHVIDRKRVAHSLVLINVSILLQVVVCGPFIAGLFLDSAAFVFRDQLQPVEFSLKHASALFNFDRKLSILLYSLSIFATIYFAFSKKASSAVQSLARVTVITLIFDVIYSLSWLTFESLRKGLRPLYFEFFIWSFTLIFLFALFGRFLGNFVYWKGKSEVLILPLLLGLVISFNSCVMTFSELSRRLIPPKDIPVIDNYLAQIRLNENDNKFRGRLLVVFGNFNSQVETSKNLYQAIGTDFQRTMVWSKGIPTLNEFGHHISPLSYLAIQNEFVEGRPSISRNTLVYNSYSGHLADLFGIRFVMSNLPLNYPDLDLKANIKTSDISIFFYQRNLVNNGILSPYQPISLKNEISSFTEMRRASFNPVTDFTITKHRYFLPKTLSPATRASLNLAPGGYQVSALSANSSVLILPIEYSNCFSLHDKNAKLIRVNEVFLGVVFQEKLNSALTYINSPFKNSLCRIKNLLQLEE